MGRGRVLCAAVWLAACAGGGEDDSFYGCGARPRVSADASAAPDAASCGDGVTDTGAGETCDDAGESAECDADCTAAACGDGVANATAGEDCDDAGESAGCNANCTAVDCGDSIVNLTAGEVCEPTNLAGETCATQGFESGALGCAADCRAFDTAACVRTELVQNDDGACTAETGCSVRPNELVECFTSGLSPPFDVVEVEYEIGSSVSPPSELLVEIYDWDGASAPGAVIDSQPMVASALAAGPHSIALASPVTVTDASTFCVGINGDAGYRLVRAPKSTGVDTSWIRAPTCGHASIKTLASAGLTGNWCIHARIAKFGP